MTAHVDEKDIDGLRWLVVRGDRRGAMRALGAAAADEIHTVIGSLPEAGALRDYVGSVVGSARLSAVLSQTRESHPDQYQEAVDLAEGAQFDTGALLLANLRGDLGGSDGLGCSDLAVRGTNSLMAHNEDGAPALEGQFMMVTLCLDDEAPVTIQWYPGFVPSNTFVVTGHGLAWGINHVQTSAPAIAAGRHFVARGLQRQPDLDSAIDYLTTHPSAGGFAYTIGEFGTGRIATIESVAGRHSVTEAEEGGPPLWHTNHLLRLDHDFDHGSDGRDAGPQVEALGLRQESVARGCVLESVQEPSSGPTVPWLLSVLADQPMPHGVCRSAVGDDPLTTLCTTAANLTTRELTLKARGHEAITFSADAFASGNI